MDDIYQALLWGIERFEMCFLLCLTESGDSRARANVTSGNGHLNMERWKAGTREWKVRPRKSFSESKVSYLTNHLGLICLNSQL